MYPDCSHFPVLPCPPPPLWPRLSQNLKIKSIIKDYKRKNKSSMRYLYTQWSVVKLWVACPLSRTESFPSHTPTRILQCGKPASTSISHFIRVLFNSSSLGCCPLWVVGVEVGEVGVVTEVFHICPSQLHLQSLISLQISLLFTVGRNTGHRLLQDFWQQNRPLTQTQPSETSWTVDISLASGGSTGHSHQYVREEGSMGRGHPHEFRLQYRLQTGLQ